MTKKIDSCRICGNRNLELVLDLGEQALTGVFPKVKHEKITTGPLRLVRCVRGCGLVQLEHSYDSSEMYGDNYGYRSGLNISMVWHLQRKVERILSQIKLNMGDVVLDIGSNDGTTLKAYPHAAIPVGYDPAGTKFLSEYPWYIELIPDFFSAESFLSRFPKAKVITSFSMFYDLEDPMAFMRDIYKSLDDDGIWVIEQSYMPSMLQTNSYDTVCHEHLEFYGLWQIKWMADRVGFNILDVEFNTVNGGSFSVTLSKKPGSWPSLSVQKVLDYETIRGFNTSAPFQDFAEKTLESKRRLLEFIDSVKAEGKTIAALGASTKGNVLLQYCGLTEKDIPCIGEVNPDKFGCYTPGTWIPIVPESEVVGKFDYLIVLPWHFKSFFKDSAKYKGQKLVFPLPYLETT
jgi:NDP-4-keto-2,6-dideoxyhexose 3-C-methyltransferase